MENKTQTTQPATPRDPEYDTPKSFPTPAHPSPMHLPKWLAILLLGFIAVGIIIGAFSFFLSQQKANKTDNQKVQKKVPPSPSTPDPTADWKKYSNPTGAYEILYPPNLKTNVYPTGDTAFTIYLPSGETFNVITYTEVKPHDTTSEPNGAVYIRETNIGGKSALEFFTNKSSFISMDPNNKLIGLPYRHFIIEDTKAVKSIEIGYFETPESKKIFDQILQTFKFINTDTETLSIDRAIDEAKNLHSNKFLIESREMTVVSAKKAAWNDGSYGCPEQGKMYTQAFTGGYEVVLSSGGRNYEYHVVYNNNEYNRTFLCEK